MIIHNGKLKASDQLAWCKALRPICAKVISSEILNLRQCNFDPALDLESNEEGLWRFTDKNPALAEWFLERREDGMPRGRGRASMADMLRIDHAVPARKNILFVTWMLGNVCNYACSYCPSALHDGSRPWVSSRRFLRFIERLVQLAKLEGRRIYIQLGGGEVTLIPDFLDVLKELKNLGCQTAIISNGTRGGNWWSEAVEYLDEAILTFHPENAQLKHFRSIVDIASRKTRTHVNIAAPPDYFEVALGTAQYLVKTCNDFTITLKPMLVDFGDTLYPYSDEQLQIMQLQHFDIRCTHPVESVRGDMLVTMSNGETRIMEACQFLVDGTNHWSGWECDIGLELLSVKYSGEIYRGLCHEGGLIGHIDLPDQFILPNTGIVCTKETCVCLLDVMTSRRRLSTASEGTKGQDISGLVQIKHNASTP